MSQTIQLDRTMTVNQIVANYPETMSVFNGFGIDTCCGGGVSVEEAARRDSLDVEVVMAALWKAVEGGR